MVIKVDIDNKIINIEGSYLIKDILDNLNKLFPNKEWEEYTLDNSVVYWYPQHFPVITPYTPDWVDNNPYYYYEPNVICDAEYAVEVSVETFDHIPYPTSTIIDNTFIATSNQFYCIEFKEN